MPSDSTSLAAETALEPAVPPVRSLAAAKLVLQEAASGFMENAALRLAAAISYTTVFSLSPLLVITVAVVGLVLGNKDYFVQQQIVAQMSALMGEAGGELARSLIDNGRLNAGGSIWATVVSLLVMLFSSTALFVQVQDALNTVWGLKPKPGGGVVRALLRARFLSFGMVLTVAFLLLVSLLVSVVISAFVGVLPQMGAASELLMRLVNFAVSLAIITLLFAMIFRFLPDARIEWRDVWTGAFLTALLFNVGKLGIGMYLGHSSPGSTFGAAGSVVVLLLWVYYSAVILLFGAEITQAYATSYGSGVNPDRHAVRVVTQEIVVDAEEARRATVENKQALAAQTASALPPVSKPPPSLVRRLAPLAGLFVLGRLSRRNRRPKITIRTGR